MEEREILLKRSAAAGEKLRDNCLSPIPTPFPRLGYEVRAVTSRTVSNGTIIWLGNKDGDLHQIHVRCDAIAAAFEPRVSVLLLSGSSPTIGSRRSGIRALHFIPEHNLLAVGKDNGDLHLVPAEGHRPCPAVHVESLTAESMPISWSEGLTPAAGDAHQYLVGITAISSLEVEGRTYLAVATRRPALYLFALRDGAIDLTTEFVLPNWVNWIVAGPDQLTLACVSRIGRVWILKPPRSARPASLSVTTNLGEAPTAVVPWKPKGNGQSGLFVGTQHGLQFVHRCRSARTISLVRGRVLSLDLGYVGGVFGLAVGHSNGQIQFVDGASLRQSVHPGVAQGNRIPPQMPLRSRNQRASVIRLVLVRAMAGEHQADLVLAALGDHRLRLFHSADPADVRKDLGDRWLRELDRQDATNDASGHAAHLADLAGTGREALGWHYFLVDTLLPLLISNAGLSQLCFDVVARVLKRRDPQLVSRVSRDIYKLAGGKVDLLLELSLAVLSAASRMPRVRESLLLQHQADLRSAIVAMDGGLGTATPGAMTNRSYAPRAGAERLALWWRFLSKYVFRGESFRLKRLRLQSLVQKNYSTGKYMDALVYHARLYQRRFDMLREWNSVGEVEAQVVSATNEPQNEPTVLISELRDDGDATAVYSTDEARPSKTFALFPGERIVHSYYEVDDEASGGVSSPVSAVALVGTVDRCRIIRLSDPRSRVKPIELSDDIVAIGSVSSSKRPTFVLLLRERSPRSRSAFKVGCLTLGSGRTEWVVPPGPVSFSDDMLSESQGYVVAASIRVNGTCIVVVGSRVGALAVVRADIGSNAMVTLGETMLSQRVTHVSLVERPGSGFIDCYVGTSRGSVFALGLELGPAEAENARSLSLESSWDHPRWIDSLGAEVVSIELWRTTLFRYPVVVVAVADGHVVVYDPTDSSSDELRVSQSGNYCFPGVRIDRINFQRSIRTFRVVPGTSLFTVSDAASAGVGRLTYLRDSLERSSSTGRRICDPPPRAVERSGALSSDLWRRFDELTGPENYAETIFPASAQATRVALYGLVRLDSGALERYAQRELFSRYQCWHDVRLEDLRERIGDVLRSFDLENDRELIKINIKMIARCLIEHRPELWELASSREDYSVGHDRSHVPIRASRVALESLLSYERGLRRRGPSAARIRVTIFKEVFRASALCDAENRELLSELFSSLIRDDSALVRGEVLRAASVCLRNLALLEKRTPKPVYREERVTPCMAAFPDGLTSAEWILRCLLEHLRRHGEVRSSSFDPDIWYPVSILVTLMSLLPADIYVILDELSREEKGAALARSVLERARRTHSVELVREIDRYVFLGRSPSASGWELIKTPDADLREKFWDVESSNRDWGLRQERLEFVKYAQELAEVPWDAPGRSAASRLQQIELALDQVEAGRAARPPFGRLRALVEYLQRRSGTDRRGTDRAEQARSIIREVVEGSRLTRAELLLLDVVVERWEEVFAFRPPSTGKEVPDLGVLGEFIAHGRSSSIFRRAEVGSPATEQTVIKVCNSPPGSDEARDFQDGLSIHSEVSMLSESIINVRCASDMRGCELPYFNKGSLTQYLEEHSDSFRDDADRCRIAEEVVRSIGAALKEIHSNGYAHCDVRMDNILVDVDDAQASRRRVVLADFDRAIRRFVESASRTKVVHEWARVRGPLGEASETALARWEPDTVELAQQGDVLHLLDVADEVLLSSRPAHRRTGANRLRKMAIQSKSEMLLRLVYLLEGLRSEGRWRLEEAMKRAIIPKDGRELMDYLTGRFRRKLRGKRPRALIAVSYATKNVEEVERFASEVRRIGREIVPSFGVMLPETGLDVGGELRTGLVAAYSHLSVHFCWVTEEYERIRYAAWEEGVAAVKCVTQVPILVGVAECPEQIKGTTPIKWSRGESVEDLARRVFEQDLVRLAFEDSDEG